MSKDIYTDYTTGIVFRFNRQRRLPSHDYSEPGYYFVTINAFARDTPFAVVEKGELVLTELGEFVQKRIRETPKYSRHWSIDDFVIMPDHVHILFRLSRARERQAEQSSHEFGKFKIHSLPYVVRNLKGDVTRWGKRHRYEERIWQRNFYDEIVRDYKHLVAVRKYIKRNPIKLVADTAANTQ